MSTAIELNHICKTIGRHSLLDDITISIGTGEVFGFLGPNGAGKTTTMKCILGIMRPDVGDIRVLGGSIDDLGVRRRIGFMPENTYLYKHLTGDEFLSFNGSFYGLSGKLLEQKKQEVLEKVGLANARNKRLSTYSKGMLQRIGLAQAILHDPGLIFFDEPMSGLDPIGRKLVKDLMLELKSQGKTIFFNTHILSDVEAICDRFAIIDHGKIIADMNIFDLGVPLEEFFINQITQS